MHTVEDMCRAGCTSRRGVRYWEEQGMLGAVERSSGGTRRYTPEQLDKAKIIAAAQFGRFSLEDIKGMLVEWDSEAREAIIYVLTAQAKLLARLLEELPNAPPAATAQEYDL